MQHHNDKTTTVYSWFTSEIRNYLNTTWLESNQVLKTDKEQGYLLPTIIGQTSTGSSQYICNQGDQYYNASCQQTYITKSTDYVRLIFREEYAGLFSKFKNLPYQNWLYKSYYNDGYNCRSSSSVDCPAGSKFGIWWTLSYGYTGSTGTVYAPYTLYVVCQSGYLSTNSCWTSENSYTTSQAYQKYEVRPVIEFRKRT